MGLIIRTKMFLGAYADIWRDGVFAKDPDLKDFLISGPAVLAALQMQHAFEMKFSHKDGAWFFVAIVVSFVE